jgi:hypothetical protein
LGDPGFAEYNLVYPLHPVRAAAALVRRIWFLFFADFRWIGALAIVWAWRRKKLFRNAPWRLAALLVGVHVVVLSAIGGATLERYLLPVMPVVLIAMAVALSALPRIAAIAGQAALLAGSAAGLLWNPPYPFPVENNLAMVDFVRLQQTAANFVGSSWADRRVATVWPLTSALARPELGYVERPLTVTPLPDFRPGTLNRLDGTQAGVLVIFSRVWDPWSLAAVAPLRRFWSRYWGYEPDISPAEAPGNLLFERVARWSRGGQWIEVYARAAESSGLSGADACSGRGCRSTFNAEAQRR